MIFFYPFRNENHWFMEVIMQLNLAKKCFEIVNKNKAKLALMVTSLIIIITKYIKKKGMLSQMANNQIKLISLLKFTVCR